MSMRDKDPSPQLLMKGGVSGNSEAVRRMDGPGGVMNQISRKMLQKWVVLMLCLVIPAMAWGQKNKGGGGGGHAAPAARPSGGGGGHAAAARPSGGGGGHAAAARPSTQSKAPASHASTQSHAPASHASTQSKAPA